MEVKIIGGLGNQMFQYATAFAIAKRTHQNLTVDISDAVKYKTHPLRLVELSCSSEFVKKAWPFEKYLFSEKIPHFMKKGMFRKHYVEKSLEYDPDIDTKSINKKIVGYFQTEKYFKEFRHELIKEFQPKTKFNSYQNELLNLIKENDTCSLHIRRGDYVSSKIANETHGTCSEKYFERAIDYLMNKGVINNKTLLFIFSDDIKWCRENICFVQGDAYHVELDMLLMSKCKNNIISNSSFSWWAAWLNENKNKTVIAPSKWFKKDIKHDIIPESWVKL